MPTKGVVLIAWVTAIATAAPSLAAAPAQADGVTRDQLFGPPRRLAMGFSVPRGISLVSQTYDSISTGS